MRLEEDMDNILDEITKLLDNEIPINRDSLRNNVINLGKVAQYCEDLYIGSKEADKLHLLNETKG